MARASGIEVRIPCRPAITTEAAHKEEALLENAEGDDGQEDHEDAESVQEVRVQHLRRDLADHQSECILSHLLPIVMETLTNFCLQLLLLQKVLEKKSRLIL